MNNYLIKNVQCFEIFHFDWTLNPHPQKLCMLISWAFLHGFQQFKLGWMHQKISYKFCLETIVDSFTPPRIQRTMSYYSFGHQPTYPNCSWYHHGPKKRKSHLSSCTVKVPILLGDRFHPYHQKIWDWQIEQSSGHNISSISFTCWSGSTLCKVRSGSCSLPLHFFFLFWWQEFVILL